MVHYRVTPASALSAAEWGRWAEIQSAVGHLDSPFFHPELTRLTASVRPDVEVATAHDGNEAIAFFPFQRGPRNAAQAVTGRLSEFHGVIAPPDAEWSPSGILRAAGLVSWHFDHLPVTQSAFAQHIWGTTTSPFIDLSSGYDAYRDSLRRSGSSLSQSERKSRKLEREVGPLRFEFHTADAAVFAALVEWKTAQHRRTNVLEVLKTPWVVNLLESVRATDTPDFGGPMSALYAGDRLVAVHLGLRSRTALHLWFPAYDVEYESHSPGLTLLLRMAEEGSRRGIVRLDLGRGEERYKQNFQSGGLTIAEGMVNRRPATAAAYRLWYKAKRTIRSSRWRRQLELPLKATKRWRQRLAFR